MLFYRDLLVTKKRIMEYDFANMQIFLQQFSDLSKLQKEIELYDDHFGGVKNVYFWFEQIKCMIFGLSKWKMNINLPDEID